MGYYENERDSRQPIEGYEFTYREQVWRLTPGFKRRLIANLRFDPEPTVRGPLKSNAEVSSDELEITIRRNHDIVSAFIASNKVYPFKVTIYRGHLGGSSSDYAIIFKGDVTEMDRGQAFATFTVANIRHLTEIEIPSYTFQSTCNHTLYGPRCRASRAAFTVSVILGDSGPYWNVERRIASAEIAAKPGFWYDAGVLTFVSPVDGLTYKRQITGSNTAGFFYISDPDSIPGFGNPAGKPADLTAGCDRKFPTCFNKFANTVNFGGFPYMPIRDPKRGII